MARGGARSGGVARAAAAGGAGARRRGRAAIAIVVGGTGVGAGIGVVGVTEAAEAELAARGDGVVDALDLAPRDRVARVGRERVARHDKQRAAIAARLGEVACEVVEEPRRTMMTLPL